MIFTAERLRELCPKASPDLIRDIAPAIEAQAPTADVDTLLRRAHFIAQIAHESAGFTRRVENLDYTADRIRAVWPRLADRADELAHNPERLANAAYANKIGNGDEASGDGWRYRGRGLVQLTGKENYRSAGKALSLELIADPSQALVPAKSVRIALWFWQSRNCSESADLDDVEGVTKRINGGTHGLTERRRLTELAKTIFLSQPSEGAVA